MGTVSARVIRRFAVAALAVVALAGTRVSEADETPKRLPDGPIVVVGGTRLPREVAARLPRLDAAGLRKILQRPGAKVVTPAGIRRTIESVEKATVANQRAADEALRSSPHLAKALRAARAPFGKEPTTRIGSGRAARSVALLSGQAAAKDIAAAKRMLDDPKQRAQAYRRVHAALARAARSPDAKRRAAALPSIEDVASRDVRGMDLALRQAIDLWLELVGGGRGTAPRAVACNAEEGAGFGGDMTGPTVPANPAGLRALATWPLEGFDTCVRNQGNRGTCASFAVCAATETLIAATRGRYVNLSEQDLYKHMRLDWGPVPPDFYDDGYCPPLSLLLQMGTLYAYPWERDWDYNPSPNRVDDDVNRVYTSSCVGYAGEACSNTNHQARRTCYQVDTTTLKEVVSEVCTFVEGIPFLGILAGWVCEKVTEVIEVVESTTVCVYDTQIAGASGFRVLGFVPFWVPPMDGDLGIATAKFFLSDRKPVVFCFAVPASFDAPPGGFVAFAEGEDTSDGFHCALVSGFVDNADLPAAVPPGAGGGYLVLKNSWGRDWGDQGYGYVPYDWAKRWGVHFLAVTDVGS